MALPTGPTSPAGTQAAWESVVPRLKSEHTPCPSLGCGKNQVLSPAEGLKIAPSSQRCWLLLSQKGREDGREDVTEGQCAGPPPRALGRTLHTAGAQPRGPGANSDKGPRKEPSLPKLQNKDSARRQRPPGPHCPGPHPCLLSQLT